MDSCGTTPRGESTEENDNHDPLGFRQPNESYYLLLEGTISSSREEEPWVCFSTHYTSLRLSTVTLLAFTGRISSFGVLRLRSGV